MKKNQSPRIFTIAIINTAVAFFSASSIAEPASNAEIANIEVTNPSNFTRTQEPLYFSFYDLGITADDARTKNLLVKENGNIIPTQIIDTNADGKADALLVATDFTPAQIRKFQVISDANLVLPPRKKQTQAEISIKEGGKWKGNVYEGGSFKNVTSLTPPPQYTDHSFFIRYEGPGIESDKVAYRVYLDARNGFDIFGKTVNDVILQKVGTDGYGSYHNPSDWGQDILTVNKSLGAGGYGFWNGKDVELVADVKQRDVNIVANGDLYSAFNIKYHDWKINNQVLDLSADLSTNAGSRLVHTRLKMSKSLPNIAIGVVKHPNTKFLQSDKEGSGETWTYAASWGKQSLSNENSYLGMAVIFKRGDRQKQTEDANSYVSVMNDNGGELDYYFLAAWDGELNGIKTEEQFKAYLDQEVERLTKEPRIRFESALSAAAKKKPLTADDALSWSKRLADSELERKTLNYAYGGWDYNRQRPSRFEYDVTGLQILALQELNSVSPDNRYSSAAEKVTGSFVADNGEIRTFKPDLYSIDLINPGRVLINLETQNHAEKYRKAVDFLREHLKKHPRTSEGAFWHRIIYPDQLWLDGVYMGIPFLAQYAATYEQGKTRHESLSEAVHEFDISRKHLRNPKNGLYFHGWDESKKAAWADKKTGLSQQHWSRGLGWLAMAAVDVLDYLPASSEPALRKSMIALVNELAADLVRYQDPETGTWWQITDKAGALGNYRESTASSMFTYFLAKAVNNGYLPESYRAYAVKSYSGLVDEFITVHTDGKISMENQCLVAGLGFGRDGSYDYYMTEPIVANDAKGNGPFILAGVEVYKLLKKNP